MSKTKHDRDKLFPLAMEWIANGGTLKSWCQANGVAQSLVTMWAGLNDANIEMYSRARQQQADLLAEEIINIVDTETDANLARVRMDGRKWFASKVAPKKYGDRIEIDQKIRATISAEPMSVDEWLKMGE